MMPSSAELDALLSRVREMRANPAYPDWNAVAYDCYRMFEDLATRYKEEFAARDRYKRQSNSWRDKALSLNSQERYFIGSDNSGHEYAVPEARKDEWRAWQELDEDDERSWKEPEYAIRIDGRFTFTDPRCE